MSGGNEEDCQKRINEARAEAYKTAKAHIQFPVCACEFADDEETLMSPCAAHTEWKKQEMIKLFGILREEYDTAVEKMPWVKTERMSLLTAIERAILNTGKRLKVFE